MGGFGALGVVNLSASAVSCKNGVPTGMSITRFIKQCVLSSDFLPKKEIATETTDGSPLSKCMRMVRTMAARHVVMPVTTRNCCIQTNGGFAAFAVSHLTELDAR